MPDQDQNVKLVPTCSSVDSDVNLYAARAVGYIPLKLVVLQGANQYGTHLYLASTAFSLKQLSVYSEAIIIRRSVSSALDLKYGSA